MLKYSTYTNLRETEGQKKRWWTNAKLRNIFSAVSVTNCATDFPICLKFCIKTQN